MSKAKKAIITITEEKDGIHARIQCLPSVGEAGVCAALGAVAFQAISEAIEKYNGATQREEEPEN